MNSAKQLAKERKYPIPQVKSFIHHQQDSSSMETQMINNIENILLQNFHDFVLLSSQEREITEAYLIFLKWVLRQDVSHFYQSLELLQKMDVFRNRKQLSLHSSKVIRNMLQWISYFDPIHRDLFQGFHQREFPKNVHDENFLDQEYQFLQVLLGSTEVDESIYSATKLNAVFQKLLELLSLRKKHAKNQLDLRNPDSKEKLIIQLDSYEVLTKELQVVSEPLSKAFHLLSKNRLVFFEDFLFQCFGIPNYEPDIHSTKIRNLISRMKIMLPSSLMIKTKNQRILCLGDWSVVYIQNQSEIQMLLRQSPAWTWLLHELMEYKNLKIEFRTIDQKKMTELRSLQKKKKYTRSEVEKIWGVSKATANRRLQKLLSQKKIRMWGDGKNIHYEF